MVFVYISKENHDHKTEWCLSTSVRRIMTIKQNGVCLHQKGDHDHKTE
jgi:hypothetical protein